MAANLARPSKPKKHWDAEVRAWSSCVRFAGVELWGRGATDDSDDRGSAVNPASHAPGRAPPAAHAPARISANPVRSIIQAHLHAHAGTAGRRPGAPLRIQWPLLKGASCCCDRPLPVCAGGCPAACNRAAARRGLLGPRCGAHGRQGRQELPAAGECWAWRSPAAPFWRMRSQMLIQQTPACSNCHGAYHSRLIRRPTPRPCSTSTSCSRASSGAR